MSQAKTPTRKASSSKKGEAARAEKKDAQKVVEFRGLELQMPAKISGTLLWDFNDLLSGDERSFSGFIGLLDSLIGAEQNAAVKAKVREDDLDLEETFEALEGLLEDVFETAGLTLGE
jgi:hypothetical protein